MNERTTDDKFVIIYVIKFKPFARVIAAIKRLKERRIVYIWEGTRGDYGIGPLLGTCMNLSSNCSLRI
jgi:hypothetical protein